MFIYLDNNATTKIDLVVFKYIKKTAHSYEAMVAEWWNNVKEQISFQDPFLSA